MSWATPAAKTASISIPALEEQVSKMAYEHATEMFRMSEDTGAHSSYVSALLGHIRYLRNEKAGELRSHAEALQKEFQMLCDMAAKLESPAIVYTSKHERDDEHF